MKNNFLFQEFRPALRFVSIFVTVYVLGNVAYGVFIESYRPIPDPVTKWVTVQSALVISALSEPVTTNLSQSGPFVLITHHGEIILSVFEGCNGLNVIIVFISFVIAFGGKWKEVVLFIFIGCLIIHVMNLARIFMLYLTAVHRPDFFYYFHKYFFTAILYLVVFVMWYGWVMWMSRTPKKDVTKA